MAWSSGAYRVDANNNTRGVRVLRTDSNGRYVHYQAAEIRKSRLGNVIANTRYKTGRWKCEKDKFVERREMRTCKWD